MIEAVVIALWSIYGIAFIVGDITSFASGSPGKGRVSFIEFLAASMIFCALISGWRIFAWIITNGPMRGIHISPVWWVVASLGAALTILLVNNFQELLGLPLQPPGLVLSGVHEVGVFFLIPFAHLIIEVVWQRRTYKILQPTGFAGS